MGEDTVTPLSCHGVPWLLPLKHPSSGALQGLFRESSRGSPGIFTLSTSLGFLPQSHPLLPILHRAARALSLNHKPYGSAAPCLKPTMAPCCPPHHFLAWLLLPWHHVGTFPPRTLPVFLLSHQQLPHAPTHLHMLFPVPAVLSPPSSR